MYAHALKTSFLFILLLDASQSFMNDRSPGRSKKEQHSYRRDGDHNFEDDSDETTTDPGTPIDSLDRSQIYEQGETRDFLKFLQRIKYDHRQLPENDDVMQINVSIVVLNIYDVTEATMDFACELFYREAWRDSRLIWDTNKFRNKSEIALHESYVSYLWHPDTFVPNAISSKNPKPLSMSHRSLLRLRNNGIILYSRRLSLIVKCNMDLSAFPHDYQLCQIDFESYGYSFEQVQYMWSEGEFKALKLLEFSLPDYVISKAYVTSRNETYATGTYSRLHLCLVFDRAAGFYFLQIIAPATALVIVAWVSLWVDREIAIQV
ncbi:hypothetical protein WR25_24269 [Diploscapter pachys]|uniref:Neurotransmitter-gated ion-channel ligand-binding domain-containing protein n=1 Tax=Diploscapter pachys TaxID=2018661 RepID=A0A2A2LJE2_9BILA|nr:hypothetical protein WR25_24269 [Diploscapter pachys]